MAKDLPENIGVENSMLFVMFSLDKKEVQFEELVKGCFDYFPQTFSLKRYRKWPDSKKIDWNLRALKKQKMIIGDPSSKFSLSSKGRKLAHDISKAVRQKKLL